MSDTSFKSYYTEQDLFRSGLQPLSFNESTNFPFSSWDANLTVFLSHTHEDRNLAKGLKHNLAKLGIKLYIDWEDSSLPKIANSETATIIRERIKYLDLFLLLATENAINSRWCPWELGIADSSKNYNDIFIIPVTGDDRKYKGSEYIAVYQRLGLNESDTLAVFSPKYQCISEGLFKEFALKKIQEKKVY